MEIIKYETPVTVEFNKLSEQYPEGAFIVYDYVDSKVVNIIAYAKYEEGMTHLDCMIKIVKERPDISFKNGIVIVPTKNKAEEASDKNNAEIRSEIYSKNIFFTVFERNVRRQAYEYRNNDNVSDRDIKIVYIEKDETIFYIGTFIESNIEKEILEKDDITILSVLDYFIRCKIYRAEKRKEELILNKKNDSEKEPISDESYESEETSERTTALKRKIKKWIAETSFNEFYRSIEKQVMGQEELKTVLVFVYNYLKCISEGKNVNNNILMAAPSGCGKTETFRALRKYFEKNIKGLIIAQIDMTSITEEGFKGTDTKGLIQPILNNPKDGGIGIIFLDEFDKKIMPSYSSNNVNVNAAVQSQILTLIEGRIYEEKNCTIDTSKTMFIGMGSFDSVRARKAEESRHSLGFNNSESSEFDHYDPISKDDMIELGGSYELLGRFITVVNYFKLKEADVNRIIDTTITKMKNSVGYDIKITNERRNKIYKSANGKYGCRLINSNIQEEVMLALRDILIDDYNNESVIILNESGHEIKCCEYE